MMPLWCFGLRNGFLDGKAEVIPAETEFDSVGLRMGIWY